jgi:predicted alpha/beta-hydrolase family hydrolase
VLALSFPLHPPGRPEKSRAAELLAVDVPMLVVQGERDSMGVPEEFPEHLQMTVLPDADHGLKVPARAELSQADALSILVEAAMEFTMREVVGNPAQPRRVAP